MAQYPTPSFTQKLSVTKSNTAGEASLGTASITGAGAATASSWGQISASLGSDTLVTQASAIIGSGSYALGEYYIEVGYGGSGSETVVAAIPVVPAIGSVSGGAGNSRVLTGSARIPAHIASGQRLAARITCGQVDINGLTVVVRLWGAPYANVEGN